MTTIHIFGLYGIVCLACVIAILWLAEDAPLVDEHEQILSEDMPRDLPISRTEFLQ